jgi:signal recognition particle subunit SRP54
MADRILGMGDVVTLVEKAREAIDEEQAKKLQEKIRKDELTIDDFLKQLEAMEKMGPLASIMKMLPGGLSQMAGDIDENQLKYAKAIIRSMTMQERENPELLNQSRRSRIAKGSARPIHEVNSLIKQFDEARKMIKMMKKGKMPPGMPGMGAPPPPGRRR